MKRLILFFFLYIFILSPLESQVNKYGIPFITNYSPQEYNASEQNWVIVQDKRGIMYFGNNSDGVLEYDGETWRQIPVSNKSSIRSLAIDEKGIIYIGAVGEFGYLEADYYGELKYISLSDQLDSSSRQFNNVEKILVIQDKVYFIPRSFVFSFSNKILLQTFPRCKTAFMGFKSNSKIFLGNYLEGLNQLQDSTIIQANGGDFYKNKNIFIFLPYDEQKNIMVGSINQKGVSNLTNYNYGNGKINNLFYDAYTNKIYELYQIRLPEIFE